MAMKSKPEQRTYFTGLVTTVDELRQLPPPFTGAGWLATDARQREGTSTLGQGREIVIHARSWCCAQKALQLILSSKLLYSGQPPALEMDLVAHNDEEPSMLDPDIRRVILRNKRFSTTSIPVACMLTAKASRKQKWSYALAKYKFSVSLYGVFGVDLEPFSATHLFVSPFPDDHVMFSHAIVSAYSAIEDLGLELRASQKKPSRIGGKWNPAVKENLEGRLTSAGVNLNEAILWTLRGPKRKTERKREIPVLSKMRWSWGPVRDCEVELVDAIAYADWLRDCVASHNVKELTKVLSLYDVVNVQHLARRLCLEVLGYWRYYEILSEQRKHGNSD